MPQSGETLPVSFLILAPALDTCMSSLLHIVDNIHKIVT